MSGFKTKLITERDMSKDFCWILHEPLIWEDDKCQVMVKKGFDFDYASIPTIITNLLPKNGQEYDRAACLHDALYSSEALGRKECDRLFLDAMKSDGVGYATRYAMYWAVKLFGWSVWNAHSKDETEHYKKFTEVMVCGK